MDIAIIYTDEFPNHITDSLSTIALLRNTLLGTCDVNGMYRAISSANSTHHESESARMEKGYNQYPALVYQLLSLQLNSSYFVITVTIIDYIQNMVTYKRSQ